MDFKRKVVHDFRKNLDVVNKFSGKRGSWLAEEKWSSGKSTRSSNGKVTANGTCRYNEDGLFKPRDMIFCLIIKKIVLSKVEKLGKFAFNLLRCLYKEWKIKLSPKKKIKRIRSVSHNYKSVLKINYLKKKQENKILEIFKKNKMKTVMNKLFFVWNNGFHRAFERRKKIGMKFEEIMNPLIFVRVKKIILGIKEIIDFKYRLQMFLISTGKILKKKIFRQVFVKKKIPKIEVKSFNAIYNPSEVFPIVYNQLTYENRKEFRSNKKISIRKMGNYKKGLCILSEFQGFFKALLRKGLLNFVAHTKKMRKSDQINATRMLIEIFKAKRNSYLKKFWAELKIYAEKKYNLNIFNQSLQKSTKILNKFISTHRTKNKIFAFTKLYLQFSYTSKLKNIKNGFSLIAKTLHLKIINRLYFGMVTIQTYTPKREIYKANIRKSPWILKNLLNLSKSHQFTQKKTVFSQLYVLFIHPKLQDFCFILKSLFFKLNFRTKLETFAFIKQRQSYYERKMFFNCMKLNYLLKKVYLKKIAYAFM